MRILIATGIYPPDIGGPAEYAKNLADLWQKQGHKVEVQVFSRFNSIPTGIRHLVYFFSILRAVSNSDFVLILDTFSSALPTVLASLLFGKKTILRTGGDFLWEAYVERTNDLVLLRDFYTTRMKKFSRKEKITFSLIRFVLRCVDTVVWSTEWQKNIFMLPYGLSKQRHFIVENYYGQHIESFEPKQKNFIATARPLQWKNTKLLKTIFESKEIRDMGASLDTTPTLHSEFIERIRNSYAVIISSLGDISPNTILDAILCGKPFIVTKETGLYDRIKDIAVFVDPESQEDITSKILWLLDATNYEEQKKKVQSFTFTHTWEQIAKEYIDVYKKIK